MILGRNPGLWLGAIVALLNVLTIVFGAHLDAEQLAALNAAAVAIVALVANAGDPTTVPTFARRLTPPGPPAAITSSATVAPSGSMATPTADAAPSAGGAMSAGGDASPPAGTP